MRLTIPYADECTPIKVTLTNNNNNNTRITSNENMANKNKFMNIKQHADRI